MTAPKKIKTLQHVSASQVSLFRGCNRKWFLERLCGRRPPSKESQRRGTAIHYALEKYLQDGVVRAAVQVNTETGRTTGLTASGKCKEGPGADGNEWWNTARFVNAALKYIPKPACQGGPEAMLEKEFSLETLNGKGPPWLGVVDLLLVGFDGEGDPEAEITDYKSSSSIRRYAKTPHELASDIQAASYAKFVLDQVPELDKVDVSLLYLETCNKVKVNTLEVPIAMNREQVQEQWDLAMMDVVEMVRLAEEVDDPMEVEPNRAECSNYGGCHQLSVCGLSALGSAFSVKTNNKGEKKLGFLELLKKQRETKAADTVDKSSVESILPPDAPSRTTSDEEAIALTPKKKAPKKKKAAKKKAKTGEPFIVVAYCKSGIATDEEVAEVAARIVEEINAAGDK